MPEFLTPWIVGFAAAATAAVCVWRSRRAFGRRESIDYEISLVLSAVCVTVAVLVSIAAALVIGWNLPRQIDKEPAYTRRLVSLRSTDGVSGRIGGGLFLTSGYIGTDQYYFYYEDSGSERVTPRRLRIGNGDGIYVVESDRDSANVQEFEWHFTSAWWRRFAIEPQASTWYFHVPHGTVQRSMQVQ